MCCIVGLRGFSLLDCDLFARGRVILRALCCTIYTLFENLSVVNSCVEVFFLCLRRKKNG